MLQSIRSEHEIVPKIERWRELNQLMKTYLDVLPSLTDAQLADPHDVHPERRDDRAAGVDRSRTSRTSRSGPSSAARSGAASRPPTATCSTAVDYSQVELRILAHVADEPVLKEVFIAGDDVHTATASQVFGKPAAELTPMDRSKAKMINYGIVYGLSDYGLADRLNIEREEAKAFIDAYLERFSRRPRVHEVDDRAGQGAGLRDDAVRPPPSDPRAAGAQLPGANAR